MLKDPCYQYWYNIRLEGDISLVCSISHGWCPFSNTVPKEEASVATPLVQRYTVRQLHHDGEWPRYRHKYIKHVGIFQLLLV
jgi:hypothetical protein